MRSLHLTEVLALVRVLIASPAADREALCRQVLRRAELADRRARKGPDRGPAAPGGTLLDALAGLPAARAFDLDDPGHCACFELAFGQLRQRPRHGFL